MNNKGLLVLISRGITTLERNPGWNRDFNNWIGQTDKRKKSPFLKLIKRSKGNGETK